MPIICQFKLKKKEKKKKGRKTKISHSHGQGKSKNLYGTQCHLVTAETKLYLYFQLQTNPTRVTFGNIY